VSVSTAVSTAAVTMIALRGVPAGLLSSGGSVYTDGHPGAGEYGAALAGFPRGLVTSESS
jgi:hypothetical protein